jgi:hypothetical protein
MVKIFHFRTITRIVTSPQKRLVTNVFGSDIVSFYRSRRARQYAVLKFPDYCPTQLATLIFSCIINFKISESLFSYNPQKILKLLKDLRAYPLLNLFTDQFMDRNFELRDWCLFFNGIVRNFGFHSSLSFVEKFFRHSESYFGIPANLLKTFLINNNRVRIENLENYIDEHDKGWRDLLSNSRNTICAFCKINLESEDFVNLPVKLLEVLPCCSTLTCVRCYTDFMYNSSISDKQCLQCQTNFIYNKSQNCFVINLDEDEIHQAIFRNNVKHSYNIPLNHNCVGPYLQNYQSGTQFHSWLLSNNMVQYSTPTSLQSRHFPKN